MKQVLLFSLLSICMLSVNSQLAWVGKNAVLPEYLNLGGSIDQGGIGTQQPEAGYEKIPAVVFRAQEFCRAELKDFDFDAQFTIVSATVYFSGTNFRNVETGHLTSASLKPISKLMARCVPGSIITFDNIKVIGPDKQPRTITGTTILLR